MSWGHGIWLALGPLPLYLGLPALTPLLCLVHPVSFPMALGHAHTALPGSVLVAASIPSLACAMVEESWDRWSGIGSSWM